MKLKNRSRFRSMLKAISWRFVATGTTFFLTWMISGELKLATSVASIEVFLKMLFYYLHERLWQCNYLKWDKEECSQNTK